MEENEQKKHFRLDKAERISIERALEKNESTRSPAHNLSRSPASISDEVKRNSTVAKGPGKGEPSFYGEAEDLPLATVGPTSSDMRCRTPSCLIRVHLRAPGASPF